MDYRKVYDSLIQKRKVTPPPVGYAEEHHIIPRSLGGNDSKDNLVKLTAREHFICHFLLVKLYSKGSFEWYKMIRAFMMMCLCESNQERYSNSRLYEKLRHHHSEAMSVAQAGTRNSQYGKKWMYNPETKVSTRVPADGVIPAGWELGRRLPTARRLRELSGLVKKRVRLTEEERHLNEEIKFRAKEERDQIKNAYRQVKKEERLLAAKNKRMALIQQYSVWYALYTEKGWHEFVRLTGYTKSKPNFVMRCAELLSHFIPQNGKRRGKHTK